MAEEAGVNEKTIRRDLHTFQEAGFPLEETVCDHGAKRGGSTRQEPGRA